MHQSKELQRKIQAYLPLHGAHVGFIVRFVMALIVVRGVTLSTVASALNPKVLPESNEKRIKRFFGKVELEGQSFASLILALIFTRFPGSPALSVVKHWISRFPSPENLIRTAKL